MENKLCKVCAKTLGRGNVSGLCRAHQFAQMNADPEAHKRRVEGIRRDSHKRRAEKRAVLLRNSAKARENPEYMAFLRERIRKIQPLSQAPEVLAKIDWAARGRAGSETKLAWCPRPYRAEYRHLIRSKLIPSAQAKQIIREQIKRDQAHLDPFAAALINAGLAA